MRAGYGDRCLPLDRWHNSQQRCSPRFKCKPLDQHNPLRNGQQNHGEGLTMCLHTHAMVFAMCMMYGELGRFQLQKVIDQSIKLLV